MPINRDLIEQVLAVIKKDPANYQYFFDTLEAPDWLEPLCEHGFFRFPPETIRQEDPERGGVTTSFPPWPESRYLARVAAVAPEGVLKVMLQLGGTDNAHVHWDLVEAARAMPTCHAAKWAIQEADWVSKQEYLYMLLPDRLGKLVAHLAEGGETQAALALARSLLTISPQYTGKNEDSEDWLGLSPRPRPKFEGYEYKYVLETCKSPLIDSAEVEALSLFCDLLDKALKDSTPIWQSQQEEFDSSFRPESKLPLNHAVELSEPRKDYLNYRVDLIGDDNSFVRDVEGWLIASVRDAAIQLVEKEQVAIKKAVEILEDYSWRIFHRISLYLLRKFPCQARELTADRLTDESKYDFQFLPREYDLLLRDYFPHAPLETKEQILAFIDQRVTVENIRDQFDETDRTPFELQRQVNQWKIDRLSNIRSSLSPLWQRRYRELTACDGLEDYEPPDPEHVRRVEASTPGSPLTQEEIKQKTIEELVSFLRSWDSASWQESPNTLGRYISNEIAERPQGFAECATAFKGVDATYVNAVLSGLREAVAKNRLFTWGQVFDLCNWVVEQPYEIPGRDPTKFEDHKDPHWGWSYKAVADLLQEGLEREDCEIPFEFRSDVWQIIAILAENPEPTREDEAKSHSSPEDGSISTVRGVALHCVIVYALWVRRSLEQQHEFDWASFGHVPEAREVLERHLDPCHDPSLAVRAVYGQYVPALDYLDRAWTSKNLPNIFPHNEIDKEFWCAAWESYIRFAGPNTTLFHRLEDEYRHALTQLNALSEKEGAESWMLQRFTEELMLFHWHGELDLQHPDGLLSLFYEKAPSTLRAKAHESVGRWLQNNKGSIETAVIQRLEVLWASRLHAARSGGGELSYENELAAFGWWFASGRFDNKWAINQLIETLKTGGSLDDKKHVVKHLATLAPYIPIPVARALHLLVEATDYLRVFMFDDEAKEALQSLLASGCEEAEEQAKRTIDHLLTLGHRDFRDLLRSSEE